MQNFSNKYKVEKSIKEVIEIIQPELEKNGFKIIQELDIAKILKENVDPDFDEYKILGVCNPKLSHELLMQDKSIGLFLPCKIALYRESGQTVVLVQRPSSISSFFYSKHIESVANKVEEILDSVFQRLI